MSEVFFMYNSQEIAERIKAVAKQQNISINQMLLGCGLGKNTISKMSAGTDIMTQNFAKIADYLGCSVDYLLGRNIPLEEDKTTFGEKNNCIKNLNTSTYAIGYVDILASSNSMTSKNSNEELDIFNKILKSAIHYSNMNDIKVKIFSDNILSVLQCNENNKYAAAKSIIIFLSYLQFIAFSKYGKLLRGYIHIDDLYIDDIFVFGRALVEAYKTESEIAVFPRIIVSDDIAVFLLQENNLNSDLIRIDHDGLCYVNYLTCHKVYPVETMQSFYSLLKDKINQENKKSNINKKVIQKLKWTQDYFLSYFREKNNNLNLQIDTYTDNQMLLQKTTDYDKLDIEDKAEIRGMIKQMLKSDKYKKTDSYAQSVHDFDNALDITPLFEKYKVNKD